MQLKRTSTYKLSSFLLSILTMVLNAKRALSEIDCAVALICLTASIFPRGFMSGLGFFVEFLLSQHYFHSQACHVMEYIPRNIGKNRLIALLSFQHQIVVLT